MCDLLRLGHALRADKNRLTGLMDPFDLRNDRMQHLGSRIENDCCPINPRKRLISFYAARGKAVELEQIIGHFDQSGRHTCEVVVAERKVCDCDGCQHDAFGSYRQTLLRFDRCVKAIWPTLKGGDTATAGTNYLDCAVIDEVVNVTSHKCFRVESEIDRCEHVVVVA